MRIPIIDDGSVVMIMLIIITAIMIMVVMMIAVGEDGGNGPEFVDDVVVSGMDDYMACSNNEYDYLMAMIQ